MWAGRSSHLIYISNQRKIRIYSLPSFTFLKSEIERLNNNINSLYSINDAGALIQTSSANKFKKVVTVDLNNGTLQTATLTGNITINSANLSNMAAGQSVSLVLTQGGSGGYTLTSDMKFAGGSKTLSTTANSIDVVTVFYDGTDYLCNLIKAYS